MSELRKFKEAIKPYIDGWKSVEVKAVCFSAYGKWINLGTRIILSEKPTTDIITFDSLPEFLRFKAFHEILDINKLDDLLVQLERGILTVCGNEIYFKIESNDVKVTPLSFSFYRDYRSERFIPLNFAYPMVILRAGESIHGLLYNHDEAIEQGYLDSGLRSYKVPYNGLDDLLVSFIGIPKPDFGHIESAFLDVVAPIPLRLGNECKLSDGKAIIHMENVGYEHLEDISIGLIEHSGGQTSNRTSFVLAKTDLKEENGHLVTHKDVGTDTSSVDIFLSFRGEFLDMLRVGDPSTILKNPRIMVYEHFDKDLTILNKYLESSDSDCFEIGIGLLLHFCGFNTGSYCLVKGKKGRSGIQEEIDLIAFADSNHVIAGECTTKEIDVNEKLSKLSRRVKEIQEILEGCSIIPLIFTTLEIDKIPRSDIEKAKKEGIGVAAIENIKEILEMAGQKKQPQEILMYLKNLIRRNELSQWKTNYR